MNVFAFIQERLGRYSKLQLCLLGAGSLFCSTCWAKVLSKDGGSIANTLTAVLLFALSFALLTYLFSQRSRKNLVVAGMLGTLLAVCIVLGSRIELSGVVGDISALGDAGLTNLRTYLLMLGIAPIAISCILVLFQCIDAIRARATNPPYAADARPNPVNSRNNSAGFHPSTAGKAAIRARFRPIDDTAAVATRRPSTSHLSPTKETFALGPLRLCPAALFLVSAVIVFACWLPILLAFYPGVNGYDFYPQLEQYSQGVLDSKHPLIHTWLLGICVDFGSWFGGLEEGVLCYCVVQMTLMALIFGFACSCVFRCTLSRGWTVAALAWFALCPLNSLLAISTTKDTLFGGCVVLAACFLALAFFYKPRKRYWIGFCAAVCLSCLLRNNSIYAYAAVLLIGGIYLLLKRRLTLQACGIALVPVLAYLAITGPLYGAIGATNSSATAEMLSVPLQQLARTAVAADDVSEADLDLITQLIPNWESYQAGISDMVKNSLDRDYLFEHLGEVVSCYISLGLQHPGVYTESFLMNTYGYWYPDTTASKRKGFSYHPYLETPSTQEKLSEYPAVEHTPLIAGAKTIEKRIVNHAWEDVPAVSTLMNSGAIIWIYLLAGGYIASRKEPKGLAGVIGFLVLYWGTCLLGPCTLVRYIYPLFTTLPLLLALLTHGCACHPLFDTQESKPASLHRASVETKVAKRPSKRLSKRAVTPEQNKDATQPRRCDTGASLPWQVPPKTRACYPSRS